MRDGVKRPTFASLMVKGAFFMLHFGVEHPDDDHPISLRVARQAWQKTVRCTRDLEEVTCPRCKLAVMKETIEALGIRP